MGRERDIERRIDHLLARARSGGDDRLLAEMDDVLARGYVCALDGDARSARLHRRADELVWRLGDAGDAKELRRLAIERRTLEAATRALRARLSDLQAVFAELGGVAPSR